MPGLERLNATQETQEIPAEATREYTAQQYFKTVRFLDNGDVVPTDQKYSEEEWRIIIDDIATSRATMREEIVDGIPQNPEAGNTERVASFVEGLGLNVTPFVIVDTQAHFANPHNDHEAHLRIKRDAQPDKTIRGKQLATPQLALAFQRVDTSPAGLEMTLVHELLHGAGVELLEIDAEENISDPRVRIVAKGISRLSASRQSFLEEGFVTLVAGIYGELCGHRSERYVYYNARNQRQESYNIDSAKVIEWACSKDPELLDIMFRLHTSEPELETEFDARLEDISSELKNLSNRMPCSKLTFKHYRELYDLLRSEAFNQQYYTHHIAPLTRQYFEDKLRANGWTGV